MTDYPEARKIIQTEEVQFRGAVSESLVQRMGAVSNFISKRQHSEKQFFINGDYSHAATPFLAIDGFTFFQYDAEIIDAWAFVQFAGTAGTTTIDVKLATTSGGSFTSIFSTVPSFNFAAGSNAWNHVGGVVSGTVAPVLSTTLVTAGSALKCDLLTSQTGLGINGCGIIIHYRPR